MLLNTQDDHPCFQQHPQHSLTVNFHLFLALSLPLHTQKQVASVFTPFLPNLCFK
eukprot:m.153543 g.153543  ORF g.153543 m.153543 type:complete len:55 (-) comp16237_c0_seq2:13-177(-)